MRFLILALLSSLFVGCSHALHQYHVSEYDTYKKSRDYRRITAKGEQFSVMYLSFDTNYVEKAYSELERKCPNGDITSINTRYSTSHGFFSWTNTIKLTAYCVN